MHSAIIQGSAQCSPARFRPVQCIYVFIYALTHTHTPMTVLYGTYVRSMYGMVTVTCVLIYHNTEYSSKRDTCVERTFQNLVRLTNIYNKNVTYKI